MRDDKGQVVAALSVEFGTPLSRMRLPILRDQLRALALGLAAALLATLLLAARFSSRLTHPVYHMVSALRAMEPSLLSERLPEGGPEEWRELCRSFNVLAEKLERAMEELGQRSEQAAELAASRRQFLADVSHNLRTPLTAVQGWLDAMQDGLVPEEETELHLERIQREITYISRTTRWLLDLARWDGGEPLLRRETFPVLEVVMEVAETLEAAAREARVSLQFNGLDPSWLVQADRARSREIFQILLENGVQHAGAGSTLRLAMWPRDERLVIQVSDDGAGFSPKAHSRAFGQSLGLTIADRLVSAHGGKLRVESQPSRGTCVEFSLPLSKESLSDGHAD